MTNHWIPPSPAMDAMLLLYPVPAIWSHWIQTGQTTSSSTTATQTLPPASRSVQAEQKEIVILTIPPSPAMGAMLLLILVPAIWSQGIQMGTVTFLSLKLTSPHQALQPMISMQIIPAEAGQIALA